MIRNFTNISNTSIELWDFNGLMVAPGSVFNGLSFGNEVMLNSTALSIGLLNGTLSLSDGTNTCVGQQAVDVLRGYTPQLTPDGKPIVTTSDRPANTYRCFSGRGDDITSTPPIIGQGASITFNVAPGDTQVVDAHYCTDVYIKDGSVSFVSAVIDTTLDIDVVCPAGVPFPSPTGTGGNVDLVGGSFVPNTTGTGAYYVVGTETKVARFVNHMHLIGEQTLGVTAPESFCLVTPYFLRFTVQNPATNNMNVQAGVLVGMYRISTL